MLAALLAPMSAYPSTEADIAELKASLSALKDQYERRIQDLETRLARAERQAADTSRRVTAADTRPAASPAAPRPMTAPAAPGPTPAASPIGQNSPSSAADFNPRLSVILNGNYYQDDIDGQGASIVGEAFMPGRLLHVHGAEADTAHDHAKTQNGFNFSEAEIAFSATVDPYFDAAAYLSIDGNGSVDLEEGYFQTRRLPYGLKVKGGKFLSDFGYINRQHPHQWDFVDQNLPYLNLLGDHGLQDTGLQLTWLPDLPVYALFGLEALQGDQEVFGASLGESEQVELDLDENQDGPRLWTAFAKLSPELPDRHALQFGMSIAHNTQHQLEERLELAVPGEEGELEEEEHHTLLRTGLEGDAMLWGIDIVYKFEGGGAHGQGDFKFQAEYLRSIVDAEIRSATLIEEKSEEELGNLRDLIGASRTFTTDGLYAQAIYGFAPKWTAGLRYDVLGLTNEVTGGAMGQDFGASDRWTLDLTWDLSEFSRLRAQYARNDIMVAPGERAHFDAFYLQFIMSLGAHGAHSF
jgi:hypothetical protein